MVLESSEEEEDSESEATNAMSISSRTEASEVSQSFSIKQGGSGTSVVTVPKLGLSVGKQQISKQASGHASGQASTQASSKVVQVS